MMKALVPAMLAILALSLPAAAAPALKLGKPDYGGTGCPGGTATVALAPDASSISVRFSQYRVSAGGNTGRAFERKACGLSIPVTAPPGYSVAVIAVDVQGQTNLPAGANATFRVEEFFAGGQGPVFSREIRGPSNGRFKASTDTQVTTWSACGASAVMRTNTSLIVRSSGQRAASASIRSQEVSNAIVYRVRYRKC